MNCLLGQCSQAVVEWTDTNIGWSARPS